jgi:hypothetical protein
MTERVTMEDIRISARAGVLAPTSFRELLERYADQHAEDARAEAQSEIDDLKAQLERAIVPKFSVGDRVKVSSLLGGTRIVGVIQRYELEGFTGLWHESSLSLLPAKCTHIVHEDNPYGWNFCPLCGEPLTSGGE